MVQKYLMVSLLAVGIMLSSGAGEALTNGQLARSSLLKISYSEEGKETVVGLDELQNLPVASLTTLTPWTDGAIEFEGVYIRDLAAMFAANAEFAQATAYNDYQIKFELNDIVAKDGFIAFKRDGQPMSRRDKGPYWLVFPWSERPELDTSTVHGLSIWQLVELSFD